MSYELFQGAEVFKNNTAVTGNGEIWSYEQLIRRSRHYAALLLGEEEDLSEARIAFMVPPGVDYVCVQWAIWISGGIAVPICITYPAPSIDYVLQDTEASRVLAADEYLPLLESLNSGESNRKLLSLSWMQGQHTDGKKKLPDVSLSRRAMILYTSGTTNLPKGVVSTHRNLKAQIDMLIEAWEWKSTDQTICILPLHHIHGIVNVVCCALRIGATCHFLPRFEAREVIELLQNEEITVFMAVPTIYFKLVAYLESLTEDERMDIKDKLTRKRLMVSGSAALPVSVMEKWYQLSGHRLLERYGMTEIGMAISNPYDGERKPGFVGMPLPSVSIRLVSDEGKINTGELGEIQVKGPAVFSEYWRRPEATAESFTSDNWFKTGDTAVLENGYYKILGRTSVDIIKSGGYKISAIEIEEVIRQFYSIEDCSVVGIPNEEWGEIVGAVIVLKNSMDMIAFQHWLAEQLPKYKIPRSFRFLNDLPKNAMGKVIKKDLIPLFLS
jgi:malonyl-CoA/methylmalonyl-CoA synthetase